MRIRNTNSQITQLPNTAKKERIHSLIFFSDSSCACGKIPTHCAAFRHFHAAFTNIRKNQTVKLLTSPLLNYTLLIHHREPTLGFLGCTSGA